MILLQLLVAWLLASHGSVPGDELQATPESQGTCFVEFRFAVPFRGTLMIWDLRATKNPEASRELKDGALSAVQLPQRVHVFLWATPEGDAVASIVDLAGKLREIVSFEPPKRSHGVVLVRVSKTRAARNADLSKIRLSGEALTGTVKTAVREDLLVLSNVPRSARLSLEPPHKSCFGKPVAADLGRLPWQILRADLSLCSELTVLINRASADSDIPFIVNLRDQYAQAGITRKRTSSPTEGTTFREIPPGTYELKVEIPRWDLVVSELVGVPVEGRVEHVIQLSIVRVTGKALWGEKTASGELRFRSQSGSRSSRVRTTVDPNGRYDVHLPEPGAYLIELRNSGLASEDGPAEIHLIPERAEYELDLSFSRTLLSGEVRDREGRPVFDATVEALLRQRDGESGAVARSDGQGRFEIHSLSPGLVTLTASKRGYRQEGAAILFRLENDDEVEKTIVLRKVRSATVTIELPNGRPAQGLRILCSPPSGPQCQPADVTDRNGLAEIDIESGLPLGCYFPSPEGSLGAFFLSSDKPSVWRVSASTADLDLLFQDDQGLPVARQEVRLRWNGHPVCPETLAEHVRFRGGWDSSREDGQVRLVALPPGWIEVYRTRVGISAPANSADTADERIAELALRAGEARTMVVTLRRRGSPGISRERLRSP